MATCEVQAVIAAKRGDAFHRAKGLADEVMMRNVRLRLIRGVDVKKSRQLDRTHTG